MQIGVENQRTAVETGGLTCGKDAMAHAARTPPDLILQATAGMRVAVR